jgi:hypothetical protein
MGEPTKDPGRPPVLPYSHGDSEQRASKERAYRESAMAAFALATATWAVVGGIAFAGRFRLPVPRLATDCSCCAVLVGAAVCLGSGSMASRALKHGDAIARRWGMTTLILHLLGIVTAIAIEKMR